MLQVKPRRIGSFFFSDRSPTITIKQSFAIVKALQILGFIDKNGWLKDDPRIGQAVRAACALQQPIGAACAATPGWRCAGLAELAAHGGACSRPHAVPVQDISVVSGAPSVGASGSVLRCLTPSPQTRKSPLWKWNQRLVNKLPWLHMDIKKLSTNPMLSVLSDRSAIFEGERLQEVFWRGWAVEQGAAWVGDVSPLLRRDIVHRKLPWVASGIRPCRTALRHRCIDCSPPLSSGAPANPLHVRQGKLAGRLHGLCPLSGIYSPPPLLS